MLNPLLRVGAHRRVARDERGAASTRRAREAVRRLAEVGIRDPASPTATRSSSRAACASASRSRPRSRATPSC